MDILCAIAYVTIKVPPSEEMGVHPFLVVLSRTRGRHRAARYMRRAQMYYQPLASIEAVSRFERPWTTWLLGPQVCSGLVCVLIHRVRV